MTDFATTVKRIVDDYLLHDPIEATLSGRHQHDSELPDMTLAGLEASRVRAKAYVATLELFPPHDLTADDQIDRTLLLAHFETEVREHDELELHRHDPCLYPDVAVHGIYSLLIRDSEPLEARLPSIQARLMGIPALLASGQANLDRSPALWTEIALDETEGGIDFLHSDVAPLCDRHPQLRRPLERATDAFRAYGRFLAEKQRLRDSMPFSIGRQLFDFKVAREHLLPYDADSLLAFGTQAMQSTLESLSKAAALLDPAKSWVELVELLRSDHPEESRLLSEYRRGVDEARQFVADRQLVTMPTNDTLDVVETPPFMRPTVPYAAYMPPGAFESAQHGLYYVTPVSPQLSAEERAEAMLGHNRYGMLLTNVHEAYPGHHLQLVRANAIPSSVRKLFEDTVLIEGWALYCEQLVLDEGMSTDPRARLFQLKDQLWRACRVIIDVNLHVNGMTFDDAVNMLVDVAHLERPNAIGEVRRYTQSPTQPLSYLVGKQQIMDLRERERARLGTTFNLGAFHDRLLSYGSIPVSLIERTFDQKPPSAT